MTARIVLVPGRLLRLLGFDVTPCPDCRKALPIFRDRYRQISFVLMDLTMPQMDGEEAIREMRRIDPRVGQRLQ